jgi:phospholipid transport system substrate-binding protein
MRIHPTAFISLLTIALFATAASAGPASDQLKSQVDQVIKLLEDPALKDKPGERRTQVRKMAEDIFDYPETSRRALGTHWNARTPQEREEFTRLFGDLLDRAYISKIDLYQGEKVKWLGETGDASDTLVKTTIAAKSGTEIPIDYRMHLKDGRWRVYDVVIEGVSLVSNYRTQFNKIVQTESYEALVQKLKTRGAAPSASPGSR